MKAEPFAGANTFLGAPDGWDAEQHGPCEGIPVYIGRGLAISVWRPTQEEIALLVGGGVLTMTVVGSSMQPVKLDVMHTDTLTQGMAEA